MPINTITFVAVVGLIAAVSQDAAAQSPTFTKDVAPILYNSCVQCHRTGSMAPMSLMTYAEVRPWARAIKQRVVRREIPHTASSSTISA